MPDTTIIDEMLPEQTTIRRLVLSLTIVLSLVNGVTAAPPIQDTPKACRSVHLWHQTADKKAPEATAFYNEVIVEDSTAGSYFMACGFSKGYFGIQELGNGKKVVLFSIWEPGTQDNPNKTPEERRVRKIKSGKDVRVKRFGGEGTGGQSFYNYAWKIGETCRFVVFAKPDGQDRTQYAGYFYVANEQRWQHLATFSTLSEGQLLKGFYSFVEDFRRDGESVKEIHRSSFGNGWILPVNSKTLVPLTRAKFTADNTQLNNIDSGIRNDRIFLQTGGETENKNTKLSKWSALETAERKPPLDLPTPFEKTVSAQATRVLAYNIKHGRGNDGKVDLDRTATVIRRLNPDVVALQEVDNGCRRTNRVNEARSLAEKTGLGHYYFGKFFDYQGGEYGMAILSRYPLRSTRNLRLPNGAEPRTSTITTIDRGANSFRIANVHFYSTEKERLAQADTLLKSLNESIDVPTVIAGDFNSRPNSSVLNLFGDWKIPDKGKDRFTFSSSKPDREIDFVMARPANLFEVLECDVIEEKIASDHRPLTFEFRLVPKSSK